MAARPFIIIGSGPSGVSAAAALLDRGVETMMIDSGLALEPERAQAVSAVAGVAPENWSRAALAGIRGAAPGRGEVPLKTSYGSDYPYRAVAASTPIDAPDIVARGSYAMGGLSNVWGASVLPYRQHDLAGWPIGEGDLAPAYAAVARFMPIAGVVDRLQTMFPLYDDRPSPHAESRQAALVRTRTERNVRHLAGAGLTVGRSRLALQPGCIRCGLCLHGCPHELIYSARHTLADLRQRGLRYVEGLTARTVSEDSAGAQVSAEDPNGRTVTIEGNHVLIAAGVINSAAILLRSQGRYDDPVLLRDSQYYLIPALARRSVGAIGREKLHTLAQLFFEVEDRTISDYTVHLQFYTYNDLFRALLEARLGPLARLVPDRLLLGRLMLFQGYLHSNHSGAIRATLSRSGGRDGLHLEPALNPETPEKVDLVVRKLARLGRWTGVHPVRPMVEITEPGRGFHLGASFPMAAEPGPGQTDRLGRPHGMSRIHLVDASVFSTIPSTTITYSAMANAYRIGSALGQERAGNG